MIIAGEISGDLHGSKIMREISLLDSKYVFYGIGGKQMINQGLHAFYDISNFPSVSISHILRNLFTILKIFFDIKKRILKMRPDKVILIDYQIFNLLLAKSIRNSNIQVASFAMLASNTLRTPWECKIFKSYFHKNFSILPMDKEPYTKKGISFTYVGTPALWYLREFITKKKNDQFSQKKIYPYCFSSRF